MANYILEKHAQDGIWNVRTHGAETTIGTLTRKGALFTAESETFRTISQGTDPVLALRTVFQTNEFFSERDGKLHLLSEDHIRSMVGNLRMPKS
jgi:hypothetical protein